MKGGRGCCFCGIARNKLESDFTAALVADFAAHGAAAIASMRCNDPSTTSSTVHGSALAIN